MATQMMAPNAPVIARRPFDRVEIGFMKDGQGRIFFLQLYGHDTVAFPISNEGKLEDAADLSFNRDPTALVDLVRCEDLGIDFKEFLRECGMVPR